MSNVQDAPARAPGPVHPAKQPFTRFLRKILKQTLPSLYNKVDRLVLTALVDLLEGEHRTEIALLVPQLARRAGVSPASATRALGRLEAAGILTRRKKKLTQAGRYIWVLGLTSAYQVTQAKADADSGAPCHVTEACQDDAAITTPRTLSVQDQHQATVAETASPADADDELSRSREQDEPSGLEATISALEAQWQADEPPAEETVRPTAVEPIPAPGAETEAVELLRAVGIDLWKAQQLAREHLLEQIRQTIETLRYRVGTIRNPAAWIIRELERGGYAPPPALAREEQRRAQQAAKDEQKEREERQRALEALTQEQERERRLQGFHALPLERQAELLEQARLSLRRISPKLAEAPLDLERPGPLSALLFELLEGVDPGPRLSGPTPREGGWGSRRSDPARPVPTRLAAGCGAGPPT